MRCSRHLFTLNCIINIIVFIIFCFNIYTIYSDSPFSLGLNLGLLHCRQILYLLSYQGPLYCPFMFIYLLTYKESGENRFYHHLCRLISLVKLNSLYCIFSLHWFLLNLPTEFIIQLIQCFLVLNLPFKTKKCLLVFWRNSQALTLEHTQHGTLKSTSDNSITWIPMGVCLHWLLLLLIFSVISSCSYF